MQNLFYVRSNFLVTKFRHWPQKVPNSYQADFKQNSHQPTCGLGTLTRMCPSPLLELLLSPHALIPHLYLEGPYTSVTWAWPQVSMQLPFVILWYSVYLQLCFIWEGLQTHNAEIFTNLPSPEAGTNLQDPVVTCWQPSRKNTRM